ncbi:MAG: hypothetical protein ACI9YL_000367 [Luteibaculaceae bacterium]|jgi:hypothetical protein
MKNYFIFAIFALAVSLSGCSQKICGGTCYSKSNNEKNSIRIRKQDTNSLACRLSNEKRLNWSLELKSHLFSGYQEVNELPESMEFIFENGKK